MPITAPKPRSAKTPEDDQRRSDGDIVSMFVKVSREQHEWLNKVSVGAEISLSKVVALLLTKVTTEEDPQQYINGLQRTMLQDQIEQLRREIEMKNEQERMLKEKLSQTSD